MVLHVYADSKVHYHSEFKRGFLLFIVGDSENTVAAEGMKKRFFS